MVFWWRRDDWGILHTKKSKKKFQFKIYNPPTNHSVPLKKSFYYSKKMKMKKKEEKNLLNVEK